VGSSEKKSRRWSKDLAKNILPIGSCPCGGTLFLYLKSEPKNVFTMYCTECQRTYSVLDPKDGPIFFIKPSDQVRVLEEAYGAELIRSLENGR
jgi:hypothetical protein